MLIKIESIKGVGKKTQEAFNHANIETTSDLLLTYPIKYDHFEISKSDFNNHNQVITIKGVIYSEPIVKQFTNIKAIIFELLVGKAIIKVIGFRQEFLMHTLKLDDLIIVKGKYNHNSSEIVSSVIQAASRHLTIKPIYNIDNILDLNIRKIIKRIITEDKTIINENLPSKIIQKYNFLSRKILINKVHLPNDNEDIREVYKRLKYEEAYFFQKSLIDKINKPYQREPKKYDLSKVKSLIEQIPYELTNDQKQAVNDCFRSFKSGDASYRLIQGDVGSGKTVVAAIAIFGAITAKEQVALMAPTEMLARQHYEYFRELFPDDIKIELLTSDTKNKRLVYERLANNGIDLIIGTQALVEAIVVFNNLGLIVIDEQHKFGVRTRDNLMKKSLKADLIYLTATPIPRTLAISLFEEAEISIIKEKPKRREPVITKYISDVNKDLIYKEVNETLARNEKVFIIAPAIDSDNSKYNVENLYLEYKKIIDKDKLFVLHGKLDNQVKRNTTNNFINAKNGVLIATTMIEVGIDIKDATLILIYDAHYFGLSQLHQLRGRVGRSDLLSKCFLISEDQDNERLQILENTSDGFILSKYDLKLRGPGALIGLEQTGFPNFKYLDFIEDYEILKKARIDLYDIISNE